MALRIENKAKDKADIWLYGEVGDGWSDCFTAKDVAEELKKLGDVKHLTVHLNSPGGSVFDGLAIYNTLKKHSAHVTTEIDGMALSIASVIALAGDEVRMAGNAMYMIHNPWAMAVGDSNEMRKMADRLDIVRGSLLGTYVAKTGETSSMEDILNWMEEETWFTAKQAHEHGFVDEVTDPIEAAAKFDLSRYHFKNVPKVDAVQKAAMPQDMALRARVARMSMKINKRRLNANGAQAQ